MERVHIFVCRYHNKENWYIDHAFSRGVLSEVNRNNVSERSPSQTKEEEETCTGKEMPIIDDTSIMQLLFPIHCKSICMETSVGSESSFQTTEIYEHVAFDFKDSK